MPAWPPPTTTRPAASLRLELAACFGLLAVTGYLAFGVAWQTSAQPYPLAFLPVPFEYWAAIRFGRRIALFAVLFEGAIATAGTLAGLGPFAVYTTGERLALLVLYVGLLAISMLIASHLVAEQARSRAKLAEQHRELQLAHAQLMEVDALKTHFLSAISHEMKTPLTVIVGNAELLEERFPDDPMVREIAEGGMRLNGQLTRILDYCALVSGSLPLYKRDVNLAELLVNVRAMFEREPNDRGLNLETEVAQELPLIEGDSRRLTQILVELVDNARKHAPAGSTIGLRAVGRPDEVRLEVWDEGNGLATDETERLRGALARPAVGAAGHETGGLGLGLTIVQQLTALHGGHLELDSAPGRGTRFAVVLPAAR